MSGTNARNAAGSLRRAREHELPRTSTAGMGAVAEAAEAAERVTAETEDAFERFEGTGWTGWTGFAREYVGVDRSGRRQEDRMPALWEKTFGEGAR
ncbi:hypothetical protein [Streptomyces erythrochromogenes]|uniref:hypothetical protein n=1 Tax=Streptomyces erythrochromogenes TaxID=285574 RepID=UPI0022545265|nr:hypothetical protein [Streptomyces erythrochromogenes]MCX5586924.1 hypothetical protein [Streptomyces erythrochromogenes]